MNQTNHLPWQPIETAPKNGTEIVLWCETSGSMLYQCRWNTCKNRWEEFTLNGLDQLAWIPLECYDFPSHWLELTTPTQ